MSRSRQVDWVANATPMVQFLAPALSTYCRRASLIPVFSWLAPPLREANRDLVLASHVRADHLCWLRPSRPCPQFLKTAVTSNSYSTTSEHLQILKEAELIIGEIERPRVCYSLNPAALKPLAAFLDRATAGLTPKERV